MPVANCPSCGGPIDFKIGSSVVVICDHCNTVVARTDVGVEDLGKVSALIDTGSPLRRDLPGKYRGTGFRLTGRTQMRHAQGGIWDEWYAAFDDGRWGWLAEAQGKYYVTFSVAAPETLPPFEKVELGQTIAGMFVQETGSATLISGEGEIPWRVVPGDTYDYADLSGAEGRFGTVDYSEVEPLLFKGQETNLTELGIGIGQEPRRSTRVKVEKLSCSNCGGALSLVAPDLTERIVCPNCGGIHDITAEGNLKYLHALHHGGPKPLIPLGSHGKIGDVDYVVAGFMQRSVTFDQKYYWTEYLLFNPNSGFRWLVDSDDHWSFAEPISAGDIIDSTRGTKATAKTLVYKNTTFKIYQDADAQVEFVAGEFYWKVTVTETVRAIDYIAPPQGISKEISGTKSEKEINYSLSHYMTVPEVEAAFGVKDLPRPKTVGMLQPYTGKSIAGIWAKLVAALFVVAILLAVTRPRHEVFSQLYDFSTLPAPPEPSQKWTRVVFTPPFQLTGKNLQVEGFSQVNNAWVYVGGDIVNEDTGLLDGFELPIEYYEGYDDGHWTEGSRSHKAFLAALPKGTYSMRLEAQWAENTTPPPVMITVKEGVFRWTHFILALVLVTVPTLFLGFRQGKFEAKRWADASFTPAGAEVDGDDDDE